MKKGAYEKGNRNKTQVAERNNNKVFINPLEVDLTVIGSL